MSWSVKVFSEVCCCWCWVWSWVLFRLEPWGFFGDLCYDLALYSSILIYAASSSLTGEIIPVKACFENESSTSTSSKLFLASPTSSTFTPVYLKILLFDLLDVPCELPPYDWIDLRIAWVFCRPRLVELCLTSWFRLRLLSPFLRP